MRLPRTFRFSRSGIAKQRLCSDSSTVKTRLAEGVAAVKRSSPSDRAHVMQTFSRLVQETGERKAALKLQAKALMASQQASIPPIMVDDDDNSRSGATTPRELDEDKPGPLSQEELDNLRLIALKEADIKRSSSSQYPPPLPSRFSSGSSHEKQQSYGLPTASYGDDAYPQEKHRPAHADPHHSLHAQPSPFNDQSSQDDVTEEELRQIREMEFAAAHSLTSPTSERDDQRRGDQAGGQLDPEELRQLRELVGSEELERLQALSLQEDAQSGAWTRRTPAGPRRDGGGVI